MTKPSSPKMDEHAPLLVPVRVRRVRPGRRVDTGVCQRFCNIAVAAVIIYSALSMLITLFIDGSCHDGRCNFDYGHWNIKTESNMTQEELRHMLVTIPSSQKAAQWSNHYASGPHLAGTNYSLAAWTRDQWTSFGIQSEIVEYDVYLSYPDGHSLAMLEQNSTTKSWDVAYEASLEEDVLEQDPTTGLYDRIPTFHGYSASGNVTAPFVYVNYGTYQDYEDLRNANISLEGKIAIARYGYIFRGLKVKRAQDLGMIGVLLYSDPGDDGEMTAENGYATYPDGPARNPSSVQRGSSQFLSVAPGDPSTPGFPSLPGCDRKPVEDSTPSIPSHPISYKDALPILKALNGIGPASTDFNQYWTSNEGLRYKGVEYNVGPSPDHVVVNLYNKQQYVTSPIWNVIGVINGTVPEEVVIVGNHRDAWIAGGAGDPNSGSSTMMETIRAFGEARAAGWQPRRTLVFGSWDGEEYALIGSTEWVEEYLPWLSGSAVAYLNVDTGVCGPRFGAAAAPLLHDVLREATTYVTSPNATVEGQTVADVWDGAIRTMGSGSDFTAFQDYAGIPSVDIGFKAGPEDPVYHYHSNYDSFHWMETHGDPGYEYHRTMAQLLGVLTALLVDRPLIPFNATTYADALTSYTDRIIAKLDAVDAAGTAAATNAEAVSTMSEEDIAHLRASTFNAMDPPTAALASHDDDDMEASRATAETVRLALADMYASIATLRNSSSALDARRESLTLQLKEKIPWWRFWDRIMLRRAVTAANGKYKKLERFFLYNRGLDGRRWFKHVVFAPGLWTGYAGATFPGLDESVDGRRWGNAVRWAKIIRKGIDQAVGSLE